MVMHIIAPLILPTHNDVNSKQKQHAFLLHVYKWDWIS